VEEGGRGTEGGAIGATEITLYREQCKSLRGLGRRERRRGRRRVRRVEEGGRGWKRGGDREQCRSLRGLGRRERRDGGRSDRSQRTM
jgi:hypothetical protein